MYFIHALLHLLDLGVFEVKKGSFEIKDTTTVVFPTTLDELIQKRLMFLKSLDENLFKLFSCLLLIGPQLDIKSIKLFLNLFIGDNRLAVLGKAKFLLCLC